MGARKFNSRDLGKLYSENNTQNIQDKKFIEALKNRLNERIQQDPQLARKAALIIEKWLQQKPK
jgi:hypothetical protein